MEPSPSARSIFQRHSRVATACLVALSVVGTDVAFAHACFFLTPRLVREQPTLRVPSALYHHDLARLVSVQGERWGVASAAYHTNSIGFRDRAPRSIPLTTDRRRILFIGDSFTEGMGVPYEKTFVGIVDDALAPRGIEVLNAGVASYCPIIYERKLRHLVEDVGLRVDDLVVFIDISDMLDEVSYRTDEKGNVLFDDERGAHERRADEKHLHPILVHLRGLERLLNRNTILLGNLYELAVLSVEPEERRPAMWTYDARAFEEYGREGIRKAIAHMDALAALARRRGIRLTVAVYPWPEQILHDDLDSRHVRVWRKWSQERGAGFIDCFPAFVRKGEEREIVKRCFIPRDNHWNEAGHRLVADVFLREYSLDAPR